MERIFPFLHEDVLYIINEYAREHTEKKELFSSLFKSYLEKNLNKINIRNYWIQYILNIKFCDLKTFIHILEISQSMYINTHIEYYVRNESYIDLYKEYNKIPMGPKLKIYHYFINNVRFHNHFLID